MLSQSLRNTEATAGEPGTLTAVRTDQWPSWRSSASTWITATWRGWCGGWRPGSWRRATTTTWPSATRWRVRTEQRHPAGLRIHSLIVLSEYEAFISGRTARTEAGVWGPLRLAGERQSGWKRHRHERQGPHFWELFDVSLTDRWRLRLYPSDYWDGFMMLLWGKIRRNYWHGIKKKKLHNMTSHDDIQVEVVILPGNCIPIPFHWLLLCNI